MLPSMPHTRAREIACDAYGTGIRLFMVFGPTGIGKSALALTLAHALGADVVSADAFQVYKGFDIGTAKLPIDQREGIAHHLIDMCDPNTQYTVKSFSDALKTLAPQLATPYVAQQPTPGSQKPLVICGGTGLYCHAILYDFGFLEEDGDDTIRHLLQQRLQKEGKVALFRELSAKDPAYAAKIDPHNPARILRGLAILEGGHLPSLVRPAHETRRQDICCIGLQQDWETLTTRIHHRTQNMVAAGWIEEVLTLRKTGISEEAPAFKALGYRDICAYLDGQITRDDCIGMIQKKTRQFAKRQMTWFKRYHHAHWLTLENTDFL